MNYPSARLLRHFRHLLAPIVLIALAVIIARNARADAAPAWGTILDAQNGSKVNFGVKWGGSAPFDRNAGGTFIPASVTKMFTAGAALEKLGPDYRFETTVNWNVLSADHPETIAGLTIVGSGDPTWGVPQLGDGPRTQLQKIAQTLYRAGVREVRGSIRFLSGDPRWDNMHAPAGWDASDIVTCDGALPHAFNVALNCATLVIHDLTHYRWREAGVPTPVVLALTAGTETALHTEGFGAGYRITGTVKPGGPAPRFQLPVFDSAAWAQTLLLNSFKSIGINVIPNAGHAAAEKLTDTSTAQNFTVKSPPLREILKPFLKDSINVIGQDLFLAIGGAAGLQAYLGGHLSSGDAAALEFNDGNGMSHLNKVTPQATYSLLDELTKSPDFGAIWDALAIAGVDGTLVDRMRGTAAEGVVRGKTGTLTEVYNLVGYVPTYDASGQATSFAPFVILAHSAATLSEAAHAAEDRVGDHLAALAH